MLWSLSKMLITYCTVHKISRVNIQYIFYYTYRQYKCYNLERFDFICNKWFLNKWFYTFIYHVSLSSFCDQHRTISVLYSMKIFGTVMKELPFYMCLVDIFSRINLFTSEKMLLMTKLSETGKSYSTKYMNSKEKP